MNTKFTTDTKLECEIAHFENINLKLESGDIIDSFKLAFKTFGKLNTNKTNAILVCHALTGDQYVAGNNPITGREGWWSRICLLYTSPSPRDRLLSRMPSSA